MNGALLSSCYIVSLLCLLFQILWCVGEGGCAPLFILELWWCIYLSLARRHKIHWLNMEPCHRQRKEWPRGTRERAAAPRDGSVPDQAISPPPLRGGLWARHGSVPQGASPNLAWFGGRLSYLFARIGVWKAPFGEIFHVFMLVTYKIMFSKYMWNLVNSKYICD
jgi:hypothetical protein